MEGAAQLTTADRQRAVYRDCAAIAIQVSELREEVKECISSLMLGFHNLAQSVLQHRAEKSAHIDAALKQLAAQLHGLRDFVCSQSITSPMNATANETPLVHQLHATVLRLLTSSARDRLHKSSDFLAVAPFSWNTCGTLRDAVPFAISALESLIDSTQRIADSNQLLSLRQSAQEKRIEELEGELSALRRDVESIVIQTSRDGLRTHAPVLSHSGDSIGALLKQLKHNISCSGSPAPLVRDVNAGAQVRVEIVRPHAPLMANPFREATLRNLIAKLRFRLAVCLVTKDLMKFRCRRSLAVSAFYYRKLRVKLNLEITKSTAEKQAAQTHGLHQSPIVTTMPAPTEALAHVWKSALRATPPTPLAKPSKTRSFKQYVENLSTHGVSQKINAPHIVTTPR